MPCSISNNTFLLYKCGVLKLLHTEIVPIFDDLIMVWSQECSTGVFIDFSKHATCYGSQIVIMK